MISTKWEYPNCAICNTSKFIKTYSHVTSSEVSGEFILVKCSQCGLIFQSPRVPSSQVGQYYPKNSYWGGESVLSNERYHNIYSQILKQHPSAGSILDVGTGTGLFLTKFQSLGWQVTGTDISAATVKHARDTFHLPVLLGELTQLKLPAKKYDVIVLNHVLEHTYDPLGTLKECYRLLKDNGLLVVAVPNIGSYGHFLFRSHWYPLQPGRHVYHFTKSTLCQLLHLSRFSPSGHLSSDWMHDYYAIFQSLRFSMSPRRQAVSAITIQEKPSTKTRPNYFVYFARMFSFLVALFEKVLNRGEVMVIFSNKIK